MSEGGIGWIPYFLERVDYVYEHHQAWTGQDFGDQLPSEMFNERVHHVLHRRRVRREESRHDLNLDNVTWECDYPHSDSTWPTSPETADAESLVGVPDDEIDKMTHRNAMRHFQFDPFAPPAARAVHGGRAAGRGHRRRHHAALADVGCVTRARTSRDRRRRVLHRRPQHRPDAERARRRVGRRRDGRRGRRAGRHRRRGHDGRLRHRQRVDARDHPAQLVPRRRARPCIPVPGDPLHRRDPGRACVTRASSSASSNGNRAASRCRRRWTEEAAVPVSSSFPSGRCHLPIGRGS